MAINIRAHRVIYLFLILLISFYNLSALKNYNYRPLITKRFIRLVKITI